MPARHLTRPRPQTQNRLCIVLPRCRQRVDARGPRVWQTLFQCLLKVMMTSAAEGKCCRAVPCRAVPCRAIGIFETWNPVGGVCFALDPETDREAVPLSDIDL
jgi:hypothetical protein